MIFSSLPFLFFYLVAVLAVYKLSPLKLRNLILLLVSLFFYGWGEPVYILIMLLSIAVDYVHGMLVERWRSDDRKARRAVASSVFFNLAILVFFKYWDFLMGNINALTGLHLPVLGLPLPIGISFYTFQTMSYTIDVYRKDAPVQKNPVTFGAYVTLFPQLIAGPIVRYKSVADQLEGRKEDLEKFVSGVRRFTVGAAKKVLLANAIGQLWDQSLAAENLTAAGAWLGLAAYAFQIYFGFSGYSDMAIGLGRMFGFDFLENFNYPYISRSVVEFWKRWHISLTTWFRDYVYYPLGGSRVDKQWKVVRNLCVVWLLTGLWHGANWTFVLWGLLNLGLLMGEKYGHLGRGAPKPLGWLYAFTAFLLTCVVFRADSIAAAGRYFMDLFCLGEGACLWSAEAGLYFRENLAILLFAALAAAPTATVLRERLAGRSAALAALWDALAAVAAVALFLVSVSFLVKGTYNPFIYFNF